MFAVVAVVVVVVVVAGVVARPSGSCLEENVHVPRLVRSGGILENAVSCLQPEGARFS